MFLYVTHTARALQSHDLSEEEIKLGITYILFWPHKDMEGLPGWVISSMSGHLRNRTNMKDDTHQVHTHSFEQDEYEMMIMTAKSYIRGSCGPKVSWHLSDRWGKPSPQKSHSGNLYRTGIELGAPLHDRRACYRLFHSGGQFWQLIWQFQNSTKLSPSAP